MITVRWGKETGWRDSLIPLKLKCFQYANSHEVQLDSYNDKVLTWHDPDEHKDNEFCQLLSKIGGYKKINENNKRGIQSNQNDSVLIKCWSQHWRKK